MSEKQYTPEQWEAVTFDKGQLLLLAGPGSGKTGVITGRLAYLILERGAAPGRILTLTFSRAAALSMRRRAIAECPQATGAVFGTFHSFFYQILTASGRYRDHSFLTPFEQKRILQIARQASAEGCFFSAGGRDFARTENRSVAINGGTENSYENSSGKSSESGPGNRSDEELLSLLSFVKNTGKLPDGTEPGPDILALLRAYRTECLSRRRLDFDDLQTLCEEYLSENSAALAAWRKRFSYVQIDEFQDINPIQYRILRLLCPQGANLFAVGDDDQSIYGFRGASPACMKAFTGDYPGAVIKELSVNFRSATGIVEAAQAWIGQNKDRMEKHIRACEGAPKGSVVRKCFAGNREELAFLCETIRKLLFLPQEKIQPTVALLVRNNAAMERYAVAFLAGGIPFCIREKRKTGLEIAMGEDFCHLIRYLHGGKRREDLIAFMNKPEHNLSRSVLTDPVTDPKTVLSCCGRAEEGSILLAAWKKAFFRLSLAEELDLSGLLRFFIKTWGYERYLERELKKERTQIEEAVRKLEAFAADRDPKRFLPLFEAYRAGLTEERPKDEALPEGKVAIMTFHGSKGLEFDHVFLVCPPERRTIKQLSENEDPEEERRVFYVAMTRAKESLVLLEREVTIRSG